MSLPLTIEKITGVVQANEGTSIFVKKIAIGESEEFANVVCLFSFRGEGQDSSQMANEAFEAFSRKVEGGGQSLLESLKLAVGAAKEYFESQNVEASLGALVFWEDACYIGRVGGDVRLLIFEPGKEAEISFESGSGPVEAGQTYLLSTGDFLSFFDKKILEGDVDLQELIDGLATEISSRQDQAEIGAAFVRVKGEKLEETVSLSKEAENIEQADFDREELPAPSGRRIAIPGFLSRLGSNLMRLVRVGSGGKRRKLMIVAVVVVLILVGSVVFEITRNMARTKEVEFNNHLSAASAKYSEGVAVISLNKVKARGILVEAKKEAEAALKIRAKDEKANSLARDIDAKLKETEIASNVNFATVADFGSTLNSVSFSGKNLAAISSDKVFEFNLSTKDKSEVKLDVAALRGTVYDNKAFVLTGDSFVRVDLRDKSKKGVAAKGSDIGIFIGNVYVLGSRQIAKYMPIEGGYADAKNYLEHDADFGDNARFTIDGFVWVASRDKIYKFNRGKRENFEISGLVGAASDFGPIYTSANLDNLYVVDRANSALLVIGKDGTYKKAYQGAEFKDATGVVVDESEENFYITSGTKILSASLK